MRRTLAATLLAVAATVATLPALPSAADPGSSGDQGSARPVTLPTGPDQTAQRALAVADRVLAGQEIASDPDATMALRDLRLALPRLTGLDRQRAQGLLARPTDANDRFGDAYATGTTKAKKCAKHVCVHWVTTTSDAPPAGWGNETLIQMEKVWKKETVSLGYKKPLTDGSKGGNSKFDVYLKDVGAKGLYGYCAAEKKKYKYTFSGYCVLDNDFNPAQFGGAAAENSLMVTAAHEFFHAVQYAYDAAEDRWFMESTATWMEERYADAVNDNVQYLPYGQLGSPEQALDTFVNGGGNQYGNWLFWEYLTERKGNGLVKSVWKQAATYQGAPDKYSLKALVDVLKTKGGFKSTFAAYTSALTLPAKSWQEGGTWGFSAPVNPYSLTSASPTTGSVAVGLNHLSSRNARFTPDGSITGASWKLKVTVDGPDGKSSPVATLLVLKTDGSVVRSPIKLNSKGVGAKTVGFDSATVANVTLTLGNASTRFRCWNSSGTYSCYGTPLDNSKKFTFKATALQP